MHEVREGLWAFFRLVLIGWAGKFHSQSSQELLAVVVANQARVTFSRIKVFHKLMLQLNEQENNRRTGVYTQTNKTTQDSRSLML